ncbi:intraflagellar transport protein 80 homolog [Teleopsis dalmanni]|uniref:intraflagellar transport protein 80 homolog n=1 Tax=Teleopsis dalmanni TaxID=139649 RepID=UPI0018CCBC7A|nr:intraflagellar transport protein 80 homolog [Teleopsis dalmanni]XP_037959691.1 intraflagellar transport protein 80 homolog [Teleopsis dalmanni]
MDWLLLGQRNSSGGTGNDTLLISSIDGRFIILNKSARVERNVTAHAAAINSARYSPDGAGLLTAADDGQIKIWSRSGMLRSTVIQSYEPVFCARWAPNSMSIIFCQGEYISIKPLTTNSKLTRWRAHDGLVLTLSWSMTSNIIATGGEDRRFKIWDTLGDNLYTSSIEEYPITSVAFNAEQNVLLVGSFNMVSLVENSGCSYSSTRFTSPMVGSIFTMSWSPDGTQVACGTSNGDLIVGYIVGKELACRHLHATTINSKTIVLEDITKLTTDVLDFPERVINFTLGYGYLLVATTNQIHIFKENYINTPIIVDGRSDVRSIQAGKKFFMVLDSTSIWVYTYTGRLHLNPRYPGSQAQTTLLNSRTVSLGLDILAIRDNSDGTVLHIFDLIPGASRQYEPNSLRSKNYITDVAACRAGNADDKYIVFIDSNSELFIYFFTEARNTNGNDRNASNGIYKIGTQVTSVMWSSEALILVGVHDAFYSVWYCPGEGAGDPTIIALTTVTIDTPELGKNMTIESFEDGIICFRSEGARLTVSVNLDCVALQLMLLEGNWQAALRICRSANNPILWATLAAAATRKNQLDISEEAYSAALQIDKVTYFQYIKNLTPLSPEHMAENSLMLRHLTEAETILLHNQKYVEAINLCLRMHKWQKALEIVEKHKPNMLESVVEQRKKYLNALETDEWDTAYMPFITKTNEKEQISD